jgi:tetratricopeptide (TPR) repeat protein
VQEVLDTQELIDTVMSRRTGVRCLVLGMLFSATLSGWGQEVSKNRDYQYVLIEAVKQKNLGQLAEAVKLYQMVIKDKPDCAVAYFEAGSIYLMTNQPELALNNLSKAYELDPDNIWYSMAYINALGANESFDEMVDLLKQKRKLDPENVEWEYQLASAYFAMGKWAKSIRTLDKIEKERGFSEKITLLKASVYESEEKYDLAKEEVEKVMAIFPEAVQFWIVAAELSLKSGDEDAAAAYYQEILEVDSLNIFALTNLTDYYRKNGDLGKSLQYLAKSFGSSQIDVQRKMAILSYYLSEEENVTKYASELSVVIEEFAQTHPDESDLRLIAADFYIQNRMYEHAYIHLKRYLELNKGNYNIYMQTIMLANAASLDEELVLITDKAQEMYPDSADIRFFRGIGLYQTEDYQRLVDNFKDQPMDRYSNPDYAPQARMLLAEAYYRIKDYPRSDSIFEALIEEDPDNHMVLNNYSYYLAQRGEQLMKAKEWSYTTVRENPDNSTFLDTYAWVLYKLGSYGEAEKYILRALEKGGKNDPEVNEHAGDIQMALESYEIALSYYKKAILLGGDKARLEEQIEKINRIRNE